MSGKAEIITNSAQLGLGLGLSLATYKYAVRLNYYSFKSAGTFAHFYIVVHDPYPDQRNFTFEDKGEKSPDRSPENS